MELSGIHLIGRGHSGRAVRFQTLSGSQVDSAERAAAMEIAGTQATVYDMRSKTSRNALSMMIAAITEPMTAEKYAELSRGKDGWRPVDPALILNEFDTLFTARDQAALRKLYESEYEVSQNDVDKIYEGKVTVVV